MQALAERLYEGITSQLQGVVLNGPGGMDGVQRYLGNLNLSFAYVEGESLLMGLKARASLRIAPQRTPLSAYYLDSMPGYCMVYWVASAGNGPAPTSNFAQSGPCLLLVDQGSSLGQRHERCQMTMPVACVAWRACRTWR